MIRTHFGQHPSPCFGCKLVSISFQPGESFKPHFNYSVGKYVNNDREFRDALKVCSERNSIATGIDHDYEPRYGKDLKPIQEADQVLDTRAKNLSDQLGLVVSYD